MAMTVDKRHTARKVRSEALLRNDLQGRTFRD